MRIIGVARTVVREAISHMQAAGLVDIRHDIGTFVLAPPTSSATLGIGCARRSSRSRRRGLIPARQ